ncbi:MAG: TadE/TadG family type IV pilus assembly protein [Rhizobiaceae bacterium]
MRRKKSKQGGSGFLSRLAGRHRRRDFAGDQDGSTAIEFTMLVIPFTLLIFAILESCISFAGQQLLSNSANNVARQLRTGQIKAADVTETSLRELICDDISILVAAGCPGLEVDLREFATFADAAKEEIKYIGSGDTRDIDTSDFDVTPGKSLTKNMLRVFYRWPIMTDIMRKRMSSLKGGTTLHFATVTWQNEPFQD